MVAPVTSTGLSQMVLRTQAYCRLIARRENVRIRMTRAGTASMTDAQEDFGSELTDLEAQIAKMQKEPGYFPLEDPMESHAACDKQLDRVRSQNIKLRRVNDQLWAQNADLKADLRRLKPTRHPVQKPSKGRPTGQRARVATLRAQLEALLGQQVGLMGPGRNQVYLSRAVLEGLASQLRVAAECRMFHEPSPPLAAV